MKKLVHPIIVFALVLVALAGSVPLPAQAVSPDIVISQVYGGAGCTTAGCSTYKNDYMVLYNLGSSSRSINGWSVQYGSATGTTAAWGVHALPNTSIAPGQYYLVAEGGNANGVNALPTPDTTGSLSMGASAGRVALVNNTTALTCSGTACASVSSIVDLVGYGTTAITYEGSGPAPAPSTSNANIRNNGGCTDTDNNSTDFTATAAAPLNSASPYHYCTGPTNPTGGGAANPNALFAGDSTLLTVAVTPGTNPPSTGLNVTCDLTAIGGSATQTFYDDGTNGDVTTGDNTFSFQATVNSGTSAGAKSLPCTISDTQARTGNASISLTVQVPAVAAALAINEIDYDQPSTDTAEFVEIRNNDGVSVDLSSYSIQMVNGNAGGAAQYRLFALPAVSLAPDDYFVLCANNTTVANCDLDVSPDTDLIQNGAPDAVALLFNGSVVDTVSYEGDSGAPYTEGTGTGLVDDPAFTGASISRCPEGSDTNQNNVDFSLHKTTPGASNACLPAVVINETDYDQPGTDAAEFVEIRNNDLFSFDLSNFSLELVNGNAGGAAVYQTIVLNSVMLAPGDYYVICANAATVANCDQDVSPDTNLIQNGAPDAIGLRYNGSLIDAVSYEGNTGAPYTEGSGAGLVDDGVNTNQGISRCPDGVDTNQNNADLSSRSLTPGAANNCAVDVAPFVVSTSPSNGATDAAIGANIIINFSENVTVSGSWFSINCNGSGLHSATVSGGPQSYTLDPNVNFTSGELCTVTVFAANIADQDGVPNNMTADYSWSFTPIDVCALAYTPIYSIQGSGLATTIPGPVTTQGIVVGDYEGPSPALRGFYIQDAIGDGDPSTSDGIFVFNGDNNNVNVGDLVRVTGTAEEYQDQTEIGSVTSVAACGTGSVAPVDVTFPVPSANYLERYEGMLVRLPQTLYVTEHYQLGRFDEVLLSSGGRLKQPTNVVLPGAPALALQAQNDLNKLILDDASQAQNPDPILFGRGGNPLSASNTLRGGDTATGIVGVLNYTWAGNSASGNAYRVRPINALNGYVNFDPTNPRPSAAPAVGGSLKVVGMNLLNFFNTFDGLPDTVDNCTNGVGGAATDCRGADTQSEFDRQWPKTVAAIVAMDADVIGFNEIENDGYGPTSAVQFLVDQLNAATAPGTYAFIDADARTGQVNTLGTDAIKVGMIYKTATVAPIGQTAVLNTVAFVNGGDGTPRSRPSLAQAFQVNATGARLIVDINHLKSKGSACEAPDAGDGQGNCNQVRVNAATELMNWLASDPTGTGDPDILMLGDYNSYAMEDPITAIKNAGFANLIESFLGPDAYSYVFDGQWGYLDHSLGSASLVSQVAGVGDYHINSDEPSVLDYNTDFKTANLQSTLYAPDQFRISDHDPVIVGLNLQVPPTANLTVKFPGISSVHTYVKKSDNTAGQATGQQVAAQTYKNDQAVFANLPNGMYDVVVVKNAQTRIIDDVVVRGSNISVDNLVATLMVNFSGINSVHTYVKTTGGGDVDNRTYKNDTASLVVLKAPYKVVVVKGSQQNTYDVDCSSGDCALNNLVATLTVNFPGINSVHTYVKTTGGGDVDNRTYKNDTASLVVLKAPYKVVVVKGSQQNTYDVDCSSGDCALNNLVATLTVNFPGISSVHTYVKTMGGGDVDNRTYKNGTTSLAVLKGTYRVVVVKGAQQNTYQPVDCTGNTCLLDNIVATLTVNFPGISSTHTYVKTDDGVAGTFGGGDVDNRTYKNGQAVLVLLKGFYDVKVVKGAQANVYDAVDCTSGICAVDNIVATLTVNFPGKTGVHLYVKSNDGVVGTASGGDVDNRTYQNNSTSLAVLKNTYDLIVKIGSDTDIVDAADCTGNTCTVTLTP